MEIKVHRGLDQIGGCITEISTATSRVFIDMGQNLPGCGELTTTEQDRELVTSLLDANRKKHEAIVYTHAHEDHVGLFEYVYEEIPQHIGEGAKELLVAKYDLIRKGKELKRNEVLHDIPELSSSELTEVVAAKEKVEKIKSFKTWKRSSKPVPFSVGDIRITPFFNCHSIYDSYMFLIEADGKRVWHMGDYRKHGYMGKCLIPTLRKYAIHIDVLITEGTMLGRSDECIHECIVSKKMSCVMEAFKYVFVLASATDIERLASIKEAAKKSNHPLYICSGMMNASMRIFTNREGGFANGLFSFHPHFYEEGKHLDNMKKKGFCIVAGAGHLDRVLSIYSQLRQEECVLIYSSWDGYYKRPEQVEIDARYKEFRDAFHNVVDIHTSGHADKQTIEEVIKTINPKEAIIGIHKEKGLELSALNLPEELKSKIHNSYGTSTL